MKYTITIPEPCHENWQAMTPTEKGRFCANCEKEVIDFTNTSTYRLAQLIDADEKICGRFRKDQLNTPFSSNKNRTLQRSGLAFGITSLLALCTPVHGQEKPVIIEQVEFETLGKVAIMEPETIKISGTVHDDQNQPLPGANIFFGNGEMAVQADFDGNFTLEIPKDSLLNGTITVRYIGCKDASIPLSATEQNIEVKMVPDEMALEEIIITGGIGIQVIKQSIFRKVINLFKRKPRYLIEEEPETVCESEEIEIERAISIANEKTIVDENLSFWPNPVKDQLFVNFKMEREESVSASLIPIDRPTQEIILKEEFKNLGNHTEILDTSGLEKGIYILVLRTGDHTSKSKVIVTH